MHLSNVEKLPITTGGSPIQLHCKNFMCITFVIPKERDCHDIYTSLLELSKPGMYTYSLSDSSNTDNTWLVTRWRKFIQLGLKT